VGASIGGKSENGRRAAPGQAQSGSGPLLTRGDYRGSAEGDLFRKLGVLTRRKRIAARDSRPYILRIAAGDSRPYILPIAAGDSRRYILRIGVRDSLQEAARAAGRWIHPYPVEKGDRDLARLKQPQRCTGANLE